MAKRGPAPGTGRRRTSRRGFSNARMGLPRGQHFTHRSTGGLRGSVRQATGVRSGLLEAFITEDTLQRVQGMLGDLAHEAPRVLMRAINDTLRKARTDTVAVVHEHSGLQKKVIRQNISLRKARRDELAGQMRLTGRRIPLIDLKARQTRRGVSYSLQGRRKRADSAFIARMPTGHKGVYIRRSQGGARVSRLPIAELKGPSVPGVFQLAPRVAVQSLEKANQNLQANVDRHVRVLLEKATR